MGAPQLGVKETGNPPSTRLGGSSDGPPAQGRREDRVNSEWGLAVMILIPIIAAVIGYFLGSVKFFREHQLKMYGELLPRILQFAYTPRRSEDQEEFNAAVARIWLYASKDTALKLDWALSCWVKPERGDFHAAMQNAIVAMRNDIQPWWRLRKRRIKAEEVKHFQIKATH